MRRCTALIPCLLCALLTLVRCSPTQTAGSVTEGGNTEVVSLRGSVTDSLGAPAAGARVRVRPESYLVDTLAAPALARRTITVVDTVTNAAGEFQVDSVDTGTYIVEMQGAGSIGATVVCRAWGDTTIVTIPRQILRATGSISGVVVEDDSGETIVNTVFVRIFGLDLAARVDTATGLFQIEGVPAGWYSLHFSSSDDIDIPEIEDSIEVRTGETTELDTTEFDGISD